MTAEEKRAYFREYRKARYEDAKKAYAAMMVFYPLTLEDLDGEEWRWIRGYEGDYQESTFGRTKSFKFHEPRIIVPALHPKGYLRVGLYKDGKGKNFYVQRLVAETFIPNPEGKPEVDHVDACTMNNFVGNLRWATGSENISYAVELGLIKSGEDNYHATFSAEQILEIRHTCIKGDPAFGLTALAKKFDVGVATIQRIVNGERYKNVD